MTLAEDGADLGDHQRASPDDSGSIPAYASLAASVDEQTKATFNLACSAERGGDVLTDPGPSTSESP